MTFSLVAIAGITILYTMAGGLKAVVYTDSIQWILLLGGLVESLDGFLFCLFLVIAQILELFVLAMSSLVRAFR